MSCFPPVLVDLGSSCRCYQLARLHCIHPSPSYASAVQLLERSAAQARQAEANLVNPPFDLEEQIVELPKNASSELSVKIAALELAAKRALFAERVSKPVFYDTAFNYIDLPMDDLLVLAGKQEKTEAKPQPIVAATTAAAAEIKDKAVEQVKKAAGVAAAGQARTTRETTPAVSDKDEKPKGWLGGWFGRS